jgi:hypothetical protein
MKFILGLICSRLLLKRARLNSFVLPLSRLWHVICDCHVIEMLLRALNLKLIQHDEKNRPPSCNDFVKYDET